MVMNTPVLENGTRKCRGKEKEVTEVLNEVLHGQ